MLNKMVLMQVMHVYFMKRTNPLLETQMCIGCFDPFDRGGLPNLCIEHNASRCLIDNMHDPTTGQNMSFD